MLNVAKVSFLKIGSKQERDLFILFSKGFTEDEKTQKWPVFVNRR